MGTLLSEISSLKIAESYSREIPVHSPICSVDQVSEKSEAPEDGVGADEVLKDAQLDYDSEDGANFHEEVDRSQIRHKNDSGFVREFFLFHRY